MLDKSGIGEIPRDPDHAWVCGMIHGILLQHLPQASNNLGGTSSEWEVLAPVDDGHGNHLDIARINTPLGNFLVKVIPAPKAQDQL